MNANSRQRTLPHRLNWGHESIGVIVNMSAEFGGAAFYPAELRLRGSRRMREPLSAVRGWGGRGKDPFQSLETSS
ncbi:hypothetical protein PHAMO_250008 [Magnetospirillum molischianum DSM 120]|uniref:Uncharacterized protein n=1 Tax=Magnetospirillum molischianum DSM 120 TaxID=1150626 RepID=H8FRZ0_MAGML|nr:hypothetical protein PHAMO_250008 [Magnetospirillum molischianum DSM 120]